MNLSTGDGAAPSTRPYLVRALHDWCTDNGFTPYIAVAVDESVRVPREYVKNQEIVLNIGFEATSGLTLGNDFITFKARFGGTSRDIAIPLDHVVAIYARENGQGMAFPAPAVHSEPAQSPTAGAAPTPLRLARAGEEDQAPAAPKSSLRSRVTPVRRLSDEADVDENAASDPAPEPGGGRPSLKRIK